MNIPLTHDKGCLGCLEKDILEEIVVEKSKIIHEKNKLIDELMKENEAFKVIVEKWQLEQDEKNRDTWDWGKRHGKM